MDDVKELSATTSASVQAGRGAGRFLISALCLALPSFAACSDASDRADAAVTVAADGSASGAESGAPLGLDNMPDARVLEGGAEGTCAKIDARPRAKASAVWFVFNPLLLDGQLAGAANTSGTTNRDWFREQLFGASGVVPKLQSSIRFGLSSHSGGLVLGQMCPRGSFVAAKPQSAAELSAAYQEVGVYQGATWHSLTLIAEEIARRNEPTQDTVLLIQDRWGDTGCTVGVDAAVQQRQAITRLTALGARVSVISLLDTPEQVDDAELRNAESRAWGMQLAQLGNGRAFASDQAAAIRLAIDDSLRQAISCEVRLDGKVQQGKECLGGVLLGGTQLVCNDPNGFRLQNENTLELTGAACEQLRNDTKASLSASFPCNAFVPLL